jgi:hypothetical protein
MKKIVAILTLFIVAGLSAPAFSQAQVAVGIKGGLNFCNLDIEGTASSNYENRTGYHAGVFSLITLTAFAIQSEILFSRQGTQYSISTTDYEANFDYINVPIICKFYLPLGLNLQVGTQVGFLTLAELKSSTSGTPTDIKDNYKDSDISASMGLGWDFPFGLTVDARYNLGLSEINGGNNNNSTKSQVFMISAGYKLIKFGK